MHFCTVFNYFRGSEYHKSTKTKNRATQDAFEKKSETLREKVAQIDTKILKTVETFFIQCRFSMYS